MTNWIQIIDLLLTACVGIHQVRRLVFDNYQKCPRAFNAFMLWATVITTVLLPANAHQGAGWSDWQQHMD